MTQRGKQEVGGILVIPVGENVQQMKRITKTAKDGYQEEVFADFQFVPMLQGKV